MADDDIDALLAEAHRLENLTKSQHFAAPGSIGPPAHGGPSSAQNRFDRDSPGLADSDSTDTGMEESTELALEAVRIRLERHKLKQLRQDRMLRKMIAAWAIGFVAFQLLFANLSFGFFLWHNQAEPDASIMIAWLSSTVVEVVGILWVIARSLFPFNDRHRDREAEKVSVT